MSEELMSCPFCGGGAEATDGYGVDDVTWVVVCENRDGWGAHCDTREEAVAAWNQRVAPDMERVPQPDWSQAPEWAMWWCVDADGDVWYSKDEPVFKKWRCMWDCEENVEMPEPPNIDIPLGVDWRTLKQQRPREEPTP